MMRMKRNIWIILGLVAVQLIFICIMPLTGRGGEVATTPKTPTAGSPKALFVGKTPPGSKRISGAGLMLSTMLNQAVSSLDVQITPLEVLEDSRCPVDVQCVWAGTVQLRVRLRSAAAETEQVFTLGTPITTEAHEIALVKVLPEPQADKVIAPSAYRFVFRITKGSPGK
jgi:hypothetical protein